MVIPLSCLANTQSRLSALFLQANHSTRPWRRLDQLASQPDLHLQASCQVHRNPHQALPVSPVRFSTTALLHLAGCPRPMVKGSCLLKATCTHHPNKQATTDMTYPRVVPPCQALQSLLSVHNKPKTSPSPQSATVHQLHKLLSPYILRQVLHT